MNERTEMNTFNQTRYDALQEMRKMDVLGKDQEQELMAMAQQKLFDMILGDPDLLAVFKRLKDR